jgi:hypothetical protein
MGERMNDERRMTDDEKSSRSFIGFIDCREVLGVITMAAARRTIAQLPTSLSSDDQQPAG